MKNARTSTPVQQIRQAISAATVASFTPIEQETRSHVETACAGYHLTRKPQTMRAWACLENGPIRPIRINGRLAWATADIKRLLKGGA
jgi:hypothetical protein